MQYKLWRFKGTRNFKLPAPGHCRPWGRRRFRGRKGAEIFGELAYAVAAQRPIPPARSRDRPTEWTPGQSSPQSPPIVPSFPWATLTYIKRL